MAENNANFIHDIIDNDIELNPKLKIHTRFPPEPNGYLHIGHCKALYIDFSTAEKYNGICNLRMDDTNPAKEDTEFVDAIQEDIHWLGFDWEDRFFYGSDYFEKTYELAEKLIKKGLAYVCELNAEEFSKYRGDLTHPAVSPYRERPIDESLELFRRMRNGEFPEGKYTLRARIDLASGNFNMRDPVLYRIRYIEHHRQGTKWCIFPMYDFAHPIQDALEGITHSLCSLEYEDHRPLYDWVINNIDLDFVNGVKPKQREFARLNITYTVMSKRYLREFVETGVVEGWDDPRMPTLCALRRRGYTAESIKEFIRSVGVSKVSSLVDIRQLEACIRDELNETAPRRICVARPVKVVIDNIDEGHEETFMLLNHPQKPEMGTREVKFTRELYIDESDFAEVPPSKFFRLKPDGEVRLMGAYIVKCVRIDKNEDGSIKEIHCTADLEAKNGNPLDGRKIKGTIHWVSAKYAEDVTLRLYNNLITFENPGDKPDGHSFTEYLNPESLVVIEHAKAEPSLKDAKALDKFQFVRDGYYCKDTKNENTFNRTVSLKSSL